jgi:hypothetical protein
MSALRLVVTVLVAVPLFLLVGWPHEWYVTLGIAVVSLAAGYLVELLVRGAKRDAGGGETGQQSGEDKPA